jgi:ribosomal protein S8
MRVKFGNGTKDVPILEVTPENYIVPEGEKQSYHVVQEVTTFDQRTGKRLSKPRIQKYGAKEFPSIARILKQQGYEITVLYDPTQYLKEQEQQAAEFKALTAEKKRELEQKKYEAEKAKMKAEILAELKAEGLIQSKTEDAASTKDVGSGSPKAGNNKKK